MDGQQVPDDDQGSRGRERSSHPGSSERGGRRRQQSGGTEQENGTHLSGEGGAFGGIIIFPPLSTLDIVVRRSTLALCECT